LHGLAIDLKKILLWILSKWVVRVWAEHKKLHIYHGIWQFIIYHVLKSPCYTLSYASWFQSTYPHILSIKYVLILTYQQCLGSPCNPIFGGFPTKILCDGLFLLCALSN
jgi:hypothetical protein